MSSRRDEPGDTGQGDGDEPVQEVSSTGGGSLGTTFAEETALDRIGRGDPEREAADAKDPAFERLLILLKESRAFDFTGYKRPSLVRRVRYRMREVGLESFEEYQDLLQLHQDEFTQLFNTILINVTSFLRDADAWRYLADNILPDVLASANGGPIRVWSAGCSAGQEPYSAAMLLHEAVGPEFRERVKIYATDIDEEALDYARQGSYTERELRGLPEGFRDRYFESSGSRWSITPDLRRNVIFGRNDLTRDAPISRINLLLCRNTLMYFNAETQSRIVSRLGFALRPSGVLFLGKAEMLLNHTAVFDPIELKRRFFRKTRNETAEGAWTAPWRLYGRDAATPENAQLRSELIMTSPVAQLAVSADGRLSMVNHRTGSLLGLSERDVGRPFADLEIAYRPAELLAELAGVMERRGGTALRGVEWQRSGSDPTFLDLQLVPLIDGSARVLGVSVTLTDVTRFHELQREVEAANRQLETAYEELQSTNEELETTNEELQSTVEELETTNEELQSTNEELETMNEELQSANDELQTTNEELRSRTLAITELNDFMQSILSSLDAAVIVVSAELLVQVWNQQAEDLWGLREQETVGQHLLNLDSGLPIGQLHPWLRSVITGHETGVYGQHLQAINRRGRSVDLRVTVTAMKAGSSPVSGALILFEELSADDLQTGTSDPVSTPADDA